MLERSNKPQWIWIASALGLAFAAALVACGSKTPPPDLPAPVYEPGGPGVPQIAPEGGLGDAAPSQDKPTLDATPPPVPNPAVSG